MLSLLKHVPSSLVGVNPSSYNNNNNNNNTIIIIYRSDNNNIITTFIKRYTIFVSSFDFTILSSYLLFVKFK